jgi:hypothetical protein
MHRTRINLKKAHFRMNYYMTVLTHLIPFPNRMKIMSKNRDLKKVFHLRYRIFNKEGQISKEEGVRNMEDLEDRLDQISFMREGPFPEERKGEVFSIVNDIMNFAITHYDRIIIHHFEQLMKALPNLRDPDQKLEMKHHLFWWVVFCVIQDHHHATVYQTYVEKHWRRFRYDHTMLQVIFSWNYLHPGFYTVVKAVNENEVIVNDLITGDQKSVVVYNENFHSEPGDLLTGLLIPFCDGTYSPIFNFLRIPKTSVSPTTQLIHNQFNHSASTSFTHFLHAAYGQLLPALHPYYQFETNINL